VPLSKCSQTSLVSNVGSVSNIAGDRKSSGKSPTSHLEFSAHLFGSPLVVSLNHASSKASVNSAGLLANFSEIGRNSGSVQSTMSAVNLINFSSSDVALIMRHSKFPPGPCRRSQLCSANFEKNSLLHLVGVVVQYPSNPEVTTPPPLQTFNQGISPFANAT